MRCSWLKGRGALTGFLDSTTGVFEDMNKVSLSFPLHYSVAICCTAAYILDRILHLRSNNCFFLLAACRINGVVDMKGSAKD